MARKEHEVEVGDYVQLQDGEINEWFRITYKGHYGFSCITQFGTSLDGVRYCYITDLKLESEMEYNF